MDWRTHDIDECKVYLGFDRGPIAQVGLPRRVGRYGWNEPYFPEFKGRLEPPQGTEMIGAVCWNSLRFESMHDVDPTSISLWGDLRHAYFLGRSTSERWAWVLFMLGYDYDSESWEWFVVAATDRECENEQVAATWLLETFWLWNTERIGKHASPTGSLRPAHYGRPHCWDA
jgi:hypothetical protein